MLPVIYKLGQDRSLKLGFRGIAKLEKTFNSQVGEWKLTGLSLTQVAEILAEALRREMPDVTAEKVMDLIDEYSDINTAYKKTFECITESFGKNETPVAEEKRPAPPETPPTILN